MYNTIIHSAIYTHIYFVIGNRRIRSLNIYFETVRSIDKINNLCRILNIILTTRSYTDAFRDDLFIVFQFFIYHENFKTIAAG